MSTIYANDAFFNGVTYISTLFCYPRDIFIREILNSFEVIRKILIHSQHFYLFFDCSKSSISENKLKSLKVARRMMKDEC